MQQAGAVSLRFVTLEANVGSAGCAYPLANDGAANLATPRYCWGGVTANVKVTAVRID